MRKSFLLLFALAFALVSRGLYAQDLLVTQEDDSLNCKITKVTKELIYFTFKHEGEVRKTLLMRPQVKSYQLGYYQSSALGQDSMFYEEPAYSRFRLAASGGWGYRTASTADDLPPAIKGYIDGLKSGYNYSLDASFFFKEQMGLGLVYNAFRASNELSHVSATMPDGTTATGKISDQITITYVGPYFTSRALNQSKLNSFFFNLGLGYMGYRNNSIVINSPLTISSSTLGISLDVGYDMSIAKNLALGVLLSTTSGTLTEYEVRTGTSVRTVQLQENQRENLSRIDLAVGLRFTR